MFYRAAAAGGSCKFDESRYESRAANVGINSGNDSDADDATTEGVECVECVGDPFSMNVVVDSLQSNEATPPDFLATNHGTISSFLIIAVDGTVQQISLADASGDWTLSGKLDIAIIGEMFPTTVVITSPAHNGILPDWASAMGGSGAVALGTLGGELLFDVTGVTITEVPNRSDDTIDTDAGGVPDDCDDCPYDPENDAGGDMVCDGVAATKLMVVDELGAAGTGKTVFVSKDRVAGITKGTGTDVNGIDVEFTFAYADGSTGGTFVLPAGASDGTSGWLVDKPQVAKYVNRLAPGGDTQAKVSVIKPGKLLKLVGKGLGDSAIDVFGAGPPSLQVIGEVVTGYCVKNGGEETCHCSAFPECAYKLIAGDTGAKLVCKGGVPDDDCTAVGGP